MVRITPKGDKFIFELNGLHQIWALKSKVVIHKSDIIRAYQDQGELQKWKGWRVGTYIPYLITAGTYYLDGKRNFWDVSNKKNTIIVETSDEAYHKLYIEVENPTIAINLLNEIK